MQLQAYSQQLEQQKWELEAANDELESSNNKLQSVNTTLETLATTDGLTQVSNRRRFEERLAEEFARARRYQTSLSVILLDVDHFKSYNDTFGHPEGDDVLKTVAQILQQAARITDIVARYGGEEFVVILPHTDASGARTIAERFRAAIEQHDWKKRAVTVSIGVASLHRTIERAAALVGAADQALYQAKTNGRNQVCGSSNDGDPLILVGAKTQQAA